MNTTSQNLSIPDIEKRISELDAIVDNIAALKAERDHLKKALPALQNLSQRGGAASPPPYASEGENKSGANGRAYQPKANTNVGRLYQILADHPEGLTIPQIIQESAKTGVPFKYGSVSSQLSQLRKRKIVKKVKGLFSLK